MHDYLTRTKLARLLLAFAAFRLAACLWWMYLVLKTALEPAVQLSTATVVPMMVSTLCPLFTATLLIGASVGVRRGAPWGRHPALFAAVLDALFFVLLDTTYATGRAWALVLALQAAVILWRFSLRWWYDEAAPE